MSLHRRRAQPTCYKRRLAKEVPPLRPQRQIDRPIQGLRFLFAAYGALREVNAPEPNHYWRTADRCRSAFQMDKNKTHWEGLDL